MKNYLYMLLLGTLLFFVVSLPVVANGFDDQVELLQFVAPGAPPESVPPDIRIEAIYIINNYLEDDSPTYAIPIDQLIPRPGWQNDSAQESMIQKRKVLLAQNLRK